MSIKDHDCAELIKRLYRELGQMWYGCPLCNSVYMQGAVTDSWTVKIVDE